MTKPLDAKKIALIKQITEMDSEAGLDKVEQTINDINQQAELDNIFKPMRESISVEELRKEQNYQGIDRDEFFRLIDELDIQEPIEDLLAMLSK